MADGEGGTAVFVGFNKKEVSESEELNRRLSLRRMANVEEMIEKLVKRVDQLEMKVDQLESEKIGWQAERRVIRLSLDQMEKDKSDWLKEKDEMNKKNEKLWGENENLKKHLEDQMREIRRAKEDIQNTVQDVEMKKSEWVKINEESGQSLKEIMAQQKCETEEIERKIVNVIKEKKRMGENK